MAIADESRDIVHRNRPPREQLDGGGHAPRQQVLLEGELTELRVGALQLPRRAVQRPRERFDRQGAPIVARDEHPRK